MIIPDRGTDGWTTGTIRRLFVGKGVTPSSTVAVWPGAKNSGCFLAKKWNLWLRLVFVAESLMLGMDGVIWCNANDTSKEVAPYYYAPNVVQFTEALGFWRSWSKTHPGGSTVRQVSASFPEMTGPALPGVEMCFSTSRIWHLAWDGVPWIKCTWERLGQRIVEMYQCLLSISISVITIT